jgi:hypothetical protein
MSLAAFTTEVMADSPRAFYTFQEASGNPQDLSGNGLHFTSAPSFAGTYEAAGPRPDWKAIEMTAGQFSRSAISSVHWPWTMEAVLRLTAGVSADAQLAAIAEVAGTTGITWRVYTTQKFSVHTPGYSFGTQSVQTLDPGEWHYIASRGRDSTFDISHWVDGAVDTGFIAQGLVNGGGGTGYVAAVDGVRWAAFVVYETNLSDARLLAHYDAYREYETPVTRTINMF